MRNKLSCINFKEEVDCINFECTVEGIESQDCIEIDCSECPRSSCESCTNWELKSN